MTETKNPSGKKLGVGSTKTLTLKRGVEQGTVRQSFSHGRTKQVVVEKVKRRVIGGEGKADATPAETAPKKRAAVKAAAAPAAAAPAPAAASVPAAASPKPSGVVLRTLTEEERSARAHALADARVREAEERRTAEEEARRRASREVVDKADREAAETRKKKEDDRHRREEEAKRKAEQEAKKRFGEDIALAKTGARPALEADEDDGPRMVRRGAGPARLAPAPKPVRGAPQKQRGRLTVVTALRADEVRERSVASFRRRTQRLKGHTSDEPKEKLIREVTIPETITIQDLANRMAERAVDVIRLLMKQGHMATINDVIDADTAQLIAEELGHTVKRVAESDVEEGLFNDVDDPEATMPRAPIVT
ncbi:MAG: translation initiation factor IF-2 N-terminal domain-containing protein, partial [Rhizobiales bacterium]|nr:translation initiation factor IF-2 N-terminal domain-containing protein [Hyphomicrobiales bacterium]